MNWTIVDSVTQIETLKKASHDIPCFLFKHSPNCSLSFIARHRVEGNWNFPEGIVRPYMVDVVVHREVSKAIEEEFSVRHESPQVLLIWQGECFYEDSHLDISTANLAHALEDIALPS